MTRKGTAVVDRGQTHRGGGILHVSREEDEEKGVLRHCPGGRIFLVRGGGCEKGEVKRLG